MHTEENTKTVTIDYTNWRGERSERIIIPLEIVFESNQWHPEPQWLLRAWDVEKKAERLFALQTIHSWDGKSQITHSK